MKFYRGEILSGHPNFPKGSAAEIRTSAMPVEIAASDIVYTKEDDEAIDRFTREIGECRTVFVSPGKMYCISQFSSAATAWHSVGYLIIRH